MRITRKQFLTEAGAAGGCTVLESLNRIFARADNSAELLLNNGAVVTMDDARPYASAVAVRAGRVLAVGSDEELSAYRGAGTQVVDLGGRGVSPGLIDAHSHLNAFGHMERMFVILRPPKVTDFASLAAVLRQAARSKPEGEWIVGRGFQDFREGRFPRRQELDEAVPKHPLLIIHWGGQFGVANTLALQQAGLLRRDAPDPYGGKYLRDRRSGLPDGVLIHYPAIYSVHAPEISEEEQRKCIRWSVEKFLREGVTCVHDNFVLPRQARQYVLLEQQGNLDLRVRVYPYVANLEQARNLVAQMRRYVGPLVRMQGVKLAVDGYALMYDVPPEHQHLAQPMHPQGIFEEMIAAIHRADLQVDVHAVGDKGVDWTLQAFAHAAGRASAARERRHRIEHFPFRKLDSIRRAAEMNVPVCVQPAIVDFRVDDFRKRDFRAMQKYLATINPLRTFLDEDVPLAFGADVPAFPYFAPRDSLRCVLSRKTATGWQLDPGEAIPFLEALRVHTLGNAYAAFDEQDVGSLQPGKLADLVIWDRDLRAVKTAEDVRRLKVQATYLGGRCVFTA